MAVNYLVKKGTPPPRSNSRGGGGELLRVLEEIMKEPGESFLIAECNTVSGANTIATSVKAGKRLVPELPEGARFKFETRTHKAEDTSELWATYELPEKARK